MDDTAVDERIRAALTREVAASVDVDVDEAWAGLLRTIDLPPTRPRGRGWLAMAAAVLVVLLVGRPAMVELAGEIANFGRFVEEVVTPAPLGDDGPAAAHEPVPPGDTYRQELRRVHDQLNGVVFSGDRIDRLADADRVLEDLLGERPELDHELRLAIAQVRAAVDERDRSSAADAHSTIEDLERQAAAR